MDQNQNKYIHEENEFLASFSQNGNVECEYESCTCSSTCIRIEIMNLKNQVERMEEKLDSVLEKLDTSIIKNCDKMGDHIDFVNNVYDTVKVPLHYISNKVQKMIGGDSRIAVVTECNANNNLIISSNKIEYADDANDDEYLFTENE
jgi:hypothetical protein